MLFDLVSACNVASPMSNLYLAHDCVDLFSSLACIFCDASKRVDMNEHSLTQHGSEYVSTVVMCLICI